MPGIDDFIVKKMSPEKRADLEAVTIFPLVQLTFKGENHDIIEATHGLEQFLAPVEYKRFAEHYKISANTVKGVYSNNVNYTITLTDSPAQLNGNALEMDVDEYPGYDGPFPENKLGDKYDLAYNTYVPANFMTENHNHEVDGKVVGFVADNGALPSCQGDSLYFVNPKIQEVAHIWAVWNGGDDDMCR